MIVYDCEIINAPSLPAEVPNRSKYKTCQSWTDYTGMGISVVVAYDYKSGEYKEFIDPIDKDQFNKFMASSQVVCGFNNHRFDDQLCRANGLKISSRKSYDILVEIWAAAGLGPKFSKYTHGGYSLDAVARANGLMPKSGKGWQAPVWWQDGEFQKVIDYCRDDVKITKGVLDLIFHDGGIINPKTGQFMQVALPY